MARVAAQGVAFYLLGLARLSPARPSSRKWGDAYTRDKEDMFRYVSPPTVSIFLASYPIMRHDHRGFSTSFAVWEHTIPGFQEPILS